MMGNNETVIAEAQDEWGPLYITEEGNIRSLYFGSNSLQSSMWLDAPFDLVIEYTQLQMASLLFIRNPSASLLFGLGGGSIAKFLWETFPRAPIHIVEIRSQLVEWAHTHFNVPSCSRIQIHTEDAFAFVKQKPTRLFDLIVIDLFNKDGMSPQLEGQQFFQDCKRYLSEDGVITWNLWQSASAEFLNKSISDFCKAFGKNILYLPSKTEGNFTLIALPKPLEKYSIKDLKTRAINLNEITQLNFPFLMRAYNNFTTQVVNSASSLNFMEDP